jgi:hypothetical protein
MVVVVCFALFLFSFSRDPNINHKNEHLKSVKRGGVEGVLSVGGNTWLLSWFRQSRNDLYTFPNRKAFFFAALMGTLVGAASRKPLYSALRSVCVLAVAMGGQRLSCPLL